ncbi:hypothetical protein AcW1_002565 [Taiwanofungus camphoratus]|nr:hypothetical protein AcV5_009780 [Antrodia cinnamomea]KAI0942769.1 hypothetical protein AcV7_002083 [Antrodia cinnamomea]KAI0943393.1 hypothetical protein AcW1_002565 [Antrodia cinnamomea]
MNLHRSDKINLDEVSIAYAVAAVVEADTDNTAGTILWSLVAMMHYPAIMKKAQTELDEVLGPEGCTAPGFQHFGQLTYCRTYQRSLRMDAHSSYLIATSELEGRHL